MVQGWAPQEARSVCGELARLVRAAWERGWQPVDLHRAVARGPSKVALPVLLDVLAAAVAEHAEPTVDPRWLDQLEEVGATVWWPGHSDHLTARAEQGEDVVRSAVLLRHLLPSLPPLERLGPLPGQATHVRRSAGAEVDDKLLTKVRMMLAKAESTPYEAEAETFTAAAQSLMARHSIDRAMVEQQASRVAGGRSATEPAAVRVGTDRPYESAKASLVSAVARANRCRAVWHKDLGFSTVVGFEVDLRAVELLYASLLVQATAAMRAEGSRTNRYGESTTRSFRSSFLEAFAQRIGERLTQASREQEEVAARAPAAAAGQTGRAGAGGQTGTAGAGGVVAAAHDAPGQRDSWAAPPRDVALVLADRQAEVDVALRVRFPRLRSSRARRDLDAEGWRSGRAAAERAQLGVRGKLA